MRGILQKLVDLLHRRYCPCQVPLPRADELPEPWSMFTGHHTVNAYLSPARVWCAECGWEAEGDDEYELLSLRLNHRCGHGDHSD